jgi:hypothetical protein
MEMDFLFVMVSVTVKSVLRNWTQAVVTQMARKGLASDLATMQPFVWIAQ